MVCAVPLEERIFVIPYPTTKDSNVSLVILFWGSLTTTFPIGSGRAWESAASGSEFGVSLFAWGYRFSTGWANPSSLNGTTVGLFEWLIRVK